MMECIWAFLAGFVAAHMLAMMVLLWLAWGTLTRPQKSKGDNDNADANVANITS